MSLLQRMVTNFVRGVRAKMRAGGGGSEIFPPPTDKKFRDVRWKHILALDFFGYFFYQEKKYRFASFKRREAESLNKRFREVTLR